MTSARMKCLNRQAALICAVKKGDCPRQVALSLGKTPQWAYAVLRRWGAVARERAEKERA